MIFYLKLTLILVVTVIDMIVATVRLLFSKTGSSFHGDSRRWSHRLLWIAGVNVKIVGIENIERSKSYVVVSNHASLFDIPIVLDSLPIDIRIMYKKELEKIPIFGWGLRRSPFISVVREDARDAFRSIDRAVASIATGVSVLIFPEGTRSETGELGKFKRGAFLLASRSGKDILPITIKGSSDIMPKGKKSFNSGKVVLTIHQAIPNQSNNDSNSEKIIMNQVRDIIQSAL